VTRSDDERIADILEAPTALLDHEVTA